MKKERTERGGDVTQYCAILDESTGEPCTRIARFFLRDVSPSMPMPEPPGDTPLCAEHYDALVEMVARFEQPGPDSDR
jgi:hypothetical protein